MDYKSQDFETEVKRLTGGKGVQVVYDSVGKTTFEKRLNCLARRGMMVLFRPVERTGRPVDPQVLNQKGSILPDAADHLPPRRGTGGPASPAPRMSSSWIRDGKLKLTIFREMPLSEAAEAHRIARGAPDRRQRSC